MTLTWGDFYFPPINLWALPKQFKDYEMNEETTCKPQWILKEAKANDIQVEGDHYKKMGMEPWDVMQMVLTEEEFVGFLKASIIKYAMRAGKKEGATKDTEKACHYKKKLEEVRKENEGW